MKKTRYNYLKTDKKTFNTNRSYLKIGALICSLLLLFTLLTGCNQTPTNPPSSTEKNNPQSTVKPTDTPKPTNTTQPVDTTEPIDTTQPNNSQSSAPPKTYNELLLELYNNKPEKNVYTYFIKDLDSNGVGELIVVHAGTEITVYTLKDTVKEIGKHDFLTGTLRLLYSNDTSYPGIIYFTVGGGAEHYRYLTIKNDQLSFEKIWDYNYSASQGTDIDLIVEHTTDKKLISESKIAYNQNQDIKQIPLESVISK